MRVYLNTYLIYKSGSN